MAENDGASGSQLHTTLSGVAWTVLPAIRHPHIKMHLENSAYVSHKWVAFLSPYMYRYNLIMHSIV